jgi:hypothetical protein
MKNFVIGAVVSWVAVHVASWAAERWNLSRMQMICIGWLCGMVFGVLTCMMEAP